MHQGPTMCHLAHSTHVDAYVHTTIYVHIHAYAHKIDEHVHLTGSSPCTMYHLLMNTFPTLLLMCTYMLVHLHVAFSFFYCLLIQVHEKKKEKKGVHQPDYLHGLGACLSHRPFQTLRGAPLASCRMRLSRTTTLGTGQSQSFW